MVPNEVIPNVNVFSLTGDSIGFGDANGALLVRKKVKQSREWQLKRMTEKPDP